MLTPTEINKSGIQATEAGAGIASGILKTTMLLTAGDKAGYALQFVFFLFFAKQYGVVPSGEYSFAFVFTYAFVCLADLGASIYLLREVARGRPGDRQLFFDCFVLRTASLLLASALGAIATAGMLHGVASQKLMLICCWGGYWVFFSLADLALAELNAHGKAAHVAILGIWLKLLSSAAGICMIYAGIDYDRVMIVFPISSLIYLCTCLIVSATTIGAVQIRFSGFRYYKNLFLTLTPFLLSILLVELLSCEDVLILGYLKEDKDVGIYSAATKITAFVVGVSTSITVAILPLLARFYVESKEMAVRASQKILRYLIICALPVSVGMAMTSTRIVDLLYPQSFHDAGLMLFIASWSIAATLIQIIYSALLTAIDRQKEKVAATALVLLTTTILNLLLIQRFSSLGASAVKVFTSIAGLVSFSYLVSKHFAKLPLLKMLIRPGIASLIMAAFIHYLGSWNLFGVIAASCFVYTVALFLTGAVESDEIEYFKSWFPRSVWSL